MLLVEVGQENLDLKTRLSEAEALNSGNQSEMMKLRRRLHTLEKQNETLENSVAAYEQERRGLEREVCYPILSSSYGCIKSHSWSA